MIRLMTFALLAVASPAMAQVPSYYYQGKRKVRVVVRTDIFSMQTTEPLNQSLRARVSSALPAASTLPAAAHDHFLVAPGTKNLASLNNSVRVLKAQNPAIKPKAVLRAGESISAPEQYLSDELSFKVYFGQTPQAVASRFHLTNVRAVSYAPDLYIANSNQTSGGLLSALTTANSMQESETVEWATPLVLKLQSLRQAPNDPLYGSQWHLKNTGSNTIPAVAGVDLNVEPAWQLATGLGINIAISDDGLETSHPDLIANVRYDLDRDVLSGDDDPNPNFVLSHSHGTGCAGVAAGVTNNGLGISGVAGNASLVGVRLLGGAITDNQEATALHWLAQETNPVDMVHINSNSWGPTDSGLIVEGPGPLTEAALETGTTLGRGGKGIVYTWAAGNGGTTDNVNRDGYANSPHVIAISASNASGTASTYSEPGAAILVNAPTSHAPGGFPNGITTTDLSGAGSGYKNNFGGTSSAAPAVAGVVALMLEINPALSYRDVMHILVQTAVKNDPLSLSWIFNGAGRSYSHTYGFGRVNAGAAVLAAQTWTNKPSLIKAPELASPGLPLAIPDNNIAGALVQFSVNTTGPLILEHVELEVNIVHPRRGDLSIDLISPSGTTSKMFVARSGDSSPNLSFWPLRSVAHWGENPNGTWIVKVADNAALNTGTVTSMSLRLQGYQAESSRVQDWGLY